MNAPDSIAATERRVVIADAGPLIALARIGQIDLLRQLFGTVSVTQAVADEVLRGGEFPDSEALSAAFRTAWLQTTGTQDTHNPAWLDACRGLINLHQIDMGEASALVLAQEQSAKGNAVLLIMDDHRGRQAALHSKLPHIGTAGLLVLAKQAGAVGAVKPALKALQHHGYFLSERVVNAVLTQAGE